MIANDINLDLATIKAVERISRKFTIDNGGCWIWVGSLSRTGYGNFYFAGRTVLAHRIVYELVFGNLANEVVLDHLCRRRNCVNPKHLEPVTQKMNTLRSPMTIAFKNSLKTHCLRGHAYTDGNIYTERREGKIVGRICKTCTSIRAKDYYERSKQWQKA